MSYIADPAANKPPHSDSHQLEQPLNGSESADKDITIAQLKPRIVDLETTNKDSAAKITGLAEAKYQSDLRVGRLLRVLENTNSTLTDTLIAQGRWK